MFDQDPYNLGDGLERISAIDGYDPLYEIVYFGSWSTYEEFGWMAILSLNGQFFELSGGYSVMCEGPQNDEWMPWAVSQDQALTSILEFEENLENF